MLLRNTVTRKLCASYIQKASFSDMIIKVDPGTRRRRQIAKELEETDQDDLDFEANFESFGTSYRQHIEELKTMREKLEYDIVKQKYFKTKLPNFLTWHDKEQIRLLHSKDPEEWNITSLSEGFPASPEIIKKILKSQWRMNSVEKMKQHDESVRENWRKLKNNEFKDLPGPLVQHLLKFSNRIDNYHNYEDMEHNFKVDYKPNLTCTEFSEIITSYEELKKKNKKILAIESKQTTEESDYIPKKCNQTVNLKIKSQSTPEDDTFFTEPVNDKQPITLSTLKNKLQTDLEKGKSLSAEDNSIIDLTGKDLVEDSRKPVQIDQMDYNKYNTGKLMVVDEKKPRYYDHLVYPEKINIPKKILKRGKTYKLNDCFYDSDGTFLYRVPGM